MEHCPVDDVYELGLAKAQKGKTHEYLVSIFFYTSSFPFFLSVSVAYIGDVGVFLLLSYGRPGGSFDRTGMYVAGKCGGFCMYGKYPEPP